MSGLFEHLAADEEGARVSGRQAVAVAQKRLSNQILPFLANAGDVENREARLSLIEGDVRQIVADVAEEYNVDPEKLQTAIDEQLKGDGVTDLDAELEDAPSAVGHTPLAAAKSDADSYRQDCPRCGKELDPNEASDQCEHCGWTLGREPTDADRDDWKQREGATKVAEADRDGGGAVKTETLPSADESGLGGPSPKIDKKEWKPNALNTDGNLEPVDTEMTGSPNPSEERDITDPAEYATQDKENFLEQTDAVTEQQELPEANDSGQSTERNVEQPHTDTFNNDGQADPVTSEVMASHTATYEVEQLGDSSGQFKVVGPSGNAQGGTYENRQDAQNAADELNKTSARTAAAQDPHKNPLRDILTSEFLPESQVTAAIEEFEANERNTDE